MRMIGLIGLVLALLFVGVLAKRQISGAPVSTVPSGATSPGGVGPLDSALQGRQIEQQFKQSLDAATQPRPMPDEAK